MMILHCSQLLPKLGLRLSFFIGFLLLLIICIAVIYPVIYSLNLRWAGRGIWFRALFMLNLVMTVFSFHFVFKFNFLPRTALLLVCFLTLAKGSLLTRPTWRGIKRSYAAEGMLYVSKNRTWLILSQTPHIGICRVCAMFMGLSEWILSPLQCLKTEKFRKNFFSKYPKFWKYNRAKMQEESWPNH